MMYQVAVYWSWGSIIGWYTVDTPKPLKEALKLYSSWDGYCEGRKLISV